MKAWWNLTQTEKVKRSYRCSVGCFAVAVLITIYMLVTTVGVKSVVSRCTVETTGEVVSVFPAAKYRYTPYLTANFDVNGTTYRASGIYHDNGELEWWYCSDAHYNVPTVTVHYNPDNPRESYACESPGKPEYLIWVTMFLIFFSGGWLFILQGNIIKKQMKGDEVN
jgi:hypothetical protein